MRLEKVRSCSGVKPTISDLITKICASALMRHRAVNVLYKDDAVELYPTANIGIEDSAHKTTMIFVFTF